MKDRSQRIALAGIGAAISLLFVVLGYYIDVLSLSLNVLAAGGMMLPLSRKYYREAALAYIAVSGLSFLIVNIGAVPFILVSGIYTIFTIFWENKGNKYLVGLPIKIVYSTLVFFILFKVTAYIAVDLNRLVFFKDISGGLLYVILNAAFTLLFLAYDRLLIYCYKYFSEKIMTKIKK
ncbi:MAG: hypothetical protein PHC84_03020 [Clostridia bacterium]|nr:hypothetical protein [Clostridia bacterium]